MKNKSIVDTVDLLMVTAIRHALNDLEKNKNQDRRIARFREETSRGAVLGELFPSLQDREISLGLDRIVVTLSPDPVPPPQDMLVPERPFRLGGKVHMQMQVTLTVPWHDQHQTLVPEMTS